MFSRTKIKFLLFILLTLSLNTFTITAQEQTPIPPLHISDQVILPGEHFSDVVLADALRDPAYPADQLIWTVSGYTALTAQITDGVLSVMPPDPGWLGSETLHIEACDSAGACSATDAIFWVMEDSNVDVTVTFVGNSGFMVTAGDKKILIDALFKGGGEYELPAAEVDLLVNALPPFDGIDLILVTHDHNDHFSAEMVCQCMKNNPGAVFVSTPAAAEAVVAEGCSDVIALNLSHGESAQVIANEIGVEAMFLSHGDLVYQNLGYVVTTGGRRFFHTGDIDANLIPLTDLQAFGIPQRNLDIAFLVHFVLIQPGLTAWVADGVNARYIIPIHYAYTTPALIPSRIRNLYPDAIFFRKEMETWTLPD